MRQYTKNQKGFSLFMTVVFMSIMLSIVLGLNIVLFDQIKTLGQAGNSVIAFFAADAGAEYISYQIIHSNIPPRTYTGVPLSGNGATYEIETKCCSPVGNPACIYDGVTNICPITPTTDPTRIDNSCRGYMYCSVVVGKYQSTRRAIEINI